MNDDLEIRSESIQEIIGTNPPFMVRWGITFIFITCVILISLCWIIKYPDTIQSQITIKTTITPKPIVNKIDGKVVKLFVKDGQFVQKNEELAFMESRAKIEDIKLLEKHTYTVDSLVLNNNWDAIKTIDFIQFNRFGEIQGAFENFFISYQTLKAYWEGRIMLGKQNIIKNELGALSKLNKNLSDQEREFEQDVKIAEDEYKTNLNLFFEGVISLLDLKNCQSKFIAKKMQLKQLQSSIINNTSSEISTSKQLVDISDNLEQEKLNFIKVLNLLKNEIANWKNNYILTAPESGKVMFSASVEEYQLYDRNKELFYIMPTDIRYIGEIFIDQYNLGKLENGQKIVIKLKSYPYEEYGVLTGKIENISEVDVNKQYLIKVNLDNGLVTNTGKILKFRYGMVGNASIITKEMKVIDKLIYKLKKI